MTVVSAANSIIFRRRRNCRPSSSAIAHPAPLTRRDSLQAIWEFSFQTVQTRVKLMAFAANPGRAWSRWRSAPGLMAFDRRLALEAALHGFDCALGSAQLLGQGHDVHRIASVLVGQ